MKQFASYLPIAVVAAMTMSGSPLHAAPSLVVAPNGVLLGVNQIEVLGLLYDVSFQSGTCQSTYNGCASFPFQTVESATAASEALLNYAFVDSPLGVFDSRPELTRGCESVPASSIYSCIALTPFELSPTGQIVSAFWAFNASREADDGANTFGFQFVDADPVQFPGAQMRTWAVWAPTSPIPELPIWQLIAAGALLLTLRRTMACNLDAGSRSRRSGSAA